MEAFRKWLKKQKQSPGSIRSHTYNVRVFQRWLTDQYLQATIVKQADILAYLQQCRERGNKNRTLASYLRSIRMYYTFLDITPNPTLHLQIKGITTAVPTGLLSEDYLQNIYKKYPEQSSNQKRNKVILGLLIYQGITTGELMKLEETDIDLKNKIIQIPSSRRSNPRSLRVESIQLPLLKEYMEQIRPELSEQEDKTLIIKSKNAKLRNTIGRVIEQIKRRHPSFRNAQQLRASRIVLWLKRYNLRQVQYMAGHRYISSTERYQMDKVEDLQKQLGKYHPLG